MDFNAFKEQLAAARRVEIPVDGAVFRVELPTEHALRCAFEANADANGRTLYIQAFRSLIQPAVTGWEGVKTTHFRSDAPEELVPFSPEALGILLDINPDISQELTAALGEKWHERRLQRESARKN